MTARERRLPIIDLCHFCNPILNEVACDFSHCRAHGLFFAQVHLLPDGTVKIFSRNSEDNTEKYPDLRDIVR